MSSDATPTEHTPCDDFPPFGYLDNPYHSWKVNPSGVLRSRVPLGMGWHVPNYGSYGRNQFAYRAHLHVGLEVAGQRVLTPAELSAAGLAVAGLAVSCELHTARRLRYVWPHPAGVRLTAEYFLVAEHALGCRITLAASEDAAEDAAQHETPVRLWLAQEIAHNPATSRAWEHGLYTVMPGAGEPSIGPAGLVGVCPEGNAWVLGAAHEGTMLMPSGAMPLDEAWLAGAPRDAHEPEGLRQATLLLAYDLALPPPGAPLVVAAALARGPEPDGALAELRSALAGGFDAAYRLRVDDDERFWSRAPQLAGDWPDSWRRGFATDLETLRMVARPPAGVFRSRWDAMQIQAPRIVLAEAALDALALGWADPATARELLLTCFTSAPRPNVPCMREDGSYNMIADDGTICGTGPEWGYPFAAIDALWRRFGDNAWLRAMYPGAAAYMDWWGAYRGDADGWLTHACSWESGQDVSARFGEQRTGGSDVRHLRPVDLQAAAAQACRLLAAWSRALGESDDDAARWNAAAEASARRTHEMWRDGWFRDLNTRQGHAGTDVRDPMQLAPLACGLASAAQIEQLRATFEALPPHAGSFPPMVWPPVALTILEAALAAGMDERAADLAAGVLGRVWRRMDARAREPDGAIPGVTREYWPEVDAAGELPSAGIEGYGWGALTVHFLVRYLVGLREEPLEHFRMVPALPAALRRPGARFVVGPLAYGAGNVTVIYEIPSVEAGQPDTGELAITLWLGGLPGAWVARDEMDGHVLAQVDAAADDGRARLAWRGVWLRGAHVERV